MCLYLFCLLREVLHNKETVLVVVYLQCKEMTWRYSYSSE